jgi:hypothetical protein
MDKDEQKQKNNLFSDYEVDHEEEGFSEFSDEAKDEVLEISKSKLRLIKRLADNVKENNDKLLDLLAVYEINDSLPEIGIGQLSDEGFERDDENEDPSKVVEGVFDGENMIGPDGKQYSVPSNYASKSKLVEGDIMKLTIINNGTFVYKQIGPTDRKRIIGSLEKGGDGNYRVEADGRSWRVLNASVTYFKGAPGDEVVLLVPKIGESRWGAIENIVKQGR